MASGRPTAQMTTLSSCVSTAIEKARADGDTLYVIFIDLSNAFPSTDQPLLRLKTCAEVQPGPCSNGRGSCIRGADHTDAFQSTVRILAGDSASLGLWNFYFSDITIPSLPDVVRLNGVSISHVEQADDVALLAKSLAALQVIVHAFVKWCADNFMTINAGKTKGMIFGPIPRRLSCIVANGIGIDFVDEYRYVGTIFCSMERSIFERNYHLKELKAHSMTGAMLGVEDMVGMVPVFVGAKLYMMRIDRRLVCGCEVVHDVDDRLVDALQRVQQRFLRRLLGVNPSSICGVLFTETGLMTLRVRRVLLAMRYLGYLLAQPDDRFAKLAVDESFWEAEGHHGSPISGMSSTGTSLCTCTLTIVFTMRARWREFRQSS